VQALAALGLMGTNPRALKLIVEAMKDKDLDIRTAAVLAAGETKSKSVAVPLRTLLSDKEPQVAFAAATTLWKMKDHAGESVLIAVADGQRSANANLVNGTLHTVDKDLHDPTALAKMGALQGASMLLGPFGFGITAYEYIRKNGGDSARTRAIDDIAEVHTPAIRRKLIAALGDKDVTVRAAAAKGLRPYHDAQVGKALLQLLDDPKLPARLTAAAAYVVTSAAGSPAPASAPKKDAGK
jgi:HEAT repeat protein